MIGPTQEKSHSSAPSLARASHNQVTWRGIRWSTQERSHSIAQSSKLSSLKRHEMAHTREQPQVQKVLQELLNMIILLTCSDIFTGKFMKFRISLKFFFTGKFMKFSISSKSFWKAKTIQVHSKRYPTSHIGTFFRAVCLFGTGE